MSKIGLPGAELTLPREPAVADYRTRRIPIASARRALDGTLNTTFVAVKRGWEVTLPGLTTAQKDALVTELVRLAALSWWPPEGGTYTVVVRGEIQVRPTERAPKRWTVAWGLEEV